MENNINLNNPNELNKEFEDRTEVVSEKEDERVVRHRKDFYIQKRIKAWFYYLTFYYFWITLFILIAGIILLIYFVIPYIDSFQEIKDTAITSWNYLIQNRTN